MSWEGTTMRSRTSFFNRTLCLSAVKRFWPLWGTYLGIWLLSLPLPLIQARATETATELRFFERVYNLAHIEGLILAAVFSVFSAMAVWSFLYNARSASGYGCLPVRREGQFLSALLAGFLPLAAGNLITALLTLLVAPAWAHALVLGEFFAIVTLMDLFFFGFATLCAQLTGHILVLPAVYGVLNFTAIVVEVLLREVLGGFVYGMKGFLGEGFLTLWLTPALALGSKVRVDVVHAPTLPAGYQVEYLYGTASVSFHGWGVLLIYALAGLVCMALALLLFRRRKMETAGDVVAVSFLRPVFRWCMALGCGLGLSSLMEFIVFSLDTGEASAFRVLLVFFLIGAFIGWFAGEMLIKKSFRVFKRRAWGGFGICCAVILALMLGMRFDLFGYERRVPKEEDIRSATVYANGRQTTLKEAENLKALTDLHRAIVADKDLNHGEGRDRIGAMSTGSVSCEIIYTLNSGRTVSRYYDLIFDVEAPERIGEAPALQALLNTPEAVTDRCTLELPAGGYTLDTYVRVWMTVPECARAAGYLSAEEYLLAEYLGYSTEEIGAMSPEKRRALVEEMLNSGSYANPDFPGWVLGEYTGPGDLENVFTQYFFTLDDRDSQALYRDCLQPDIREGSLGKMWLYAGEGWEKGYNATIEVQCYERKEDSSSPYASPRTGWLELNPGTDSLRTNAWLRERGLVLHTVAEVNAAEARSEMSRALNEW